MDVTGAARCRHPAVPQLRRCCAVQRLNMPRPGQAIPVALPPECACPILAHHHLTWQRISPDKCCPPRTCPLCGSGPGCTFPPRLPWAPAQHAA